MNIFKEMLTISKKLNKNIFRVQTIGLKRICCLIENDNNNCYNNNNNNMLLLLIKQHHKCLAEKEEGFMQGSITTSTGKCTCRPDSGFTCIAFLSNIISYTFFLVFSIILVFIFLLFFLLLLKRFVGF